MSGKYRIQLFDLLYAISTALDLVDSNLAHHHTQVAYMSLQMGKRLGLGHESLQNLVMAAILHDIGALSRSERLALLDFEADNPKQHALLGYHLLRGFVPFERVAKLVRYHHHFWNDPPQGEEVPLESHIIHLVDRVDALIKEDQYILEQSDEIRARIKARSGSLFHPELVEVFLEISDSESFWLSISSNSVPSVIQDEAQLGSLELDISELLEMTRLFSKLIDFRNPFTASHSIGVAACAVAIARLVGFSGEECKLMEAAGYLHDLGKITVPNEILEKTSDLSPMEWKKVRSHSFYTSLILNSLKSIAHVVEWASHHHERLDKSGYPFRLEDERISLGARVVAVADVFTAITEDRPYRPGMSPQEALEAICHLAKTGGLDGRIVDLVTNHFDEINQARIQAQAQGSSEYRHLMQLLSFSSAAL